jgi:hypothetical protein
VDAMVDTAVAVTAAVTAVAAVIRKFRRFSISSYYNFSIICCPILVT